MTFFNASRVSISFKLLGCFLILGALILKTLNISDIEIIEVIQGVLALQALVLPIDISKIKIASIKNRNFQEEAE